jgi:hypothetical protein
LQFISGVHYPSLWPSDSCKEPLDVSNNFTFKGIDGILSCDKSMLILSPTVSFLKKNEKIGHDEYIMVTLS